MADASSVAYDALKMAVEHVLGKIREGKKLSTEDVLILILAPLSSLYVGYLFVAYIFV
jgi:uncharacterized coiled-coil DUF342 family protein